MKVNFFKPEDFASRDNCPENLAEHANALLKGRGVVVWGQPASKGWVFSEGNKDNEYSTHQALLINIHPIEKEETAESLLREACEKLNFNFAYRPHELQDRIKAFLKRKGK